MKCKLNLGGLGNKLVIIGEELDLLALVIGLSLELEVLEAQVIQGECYLCVEQQSVTFDGSF
eukprot:4430730-Ditylum_brightwellii.AAC.1